MGKQLTIPTDLFPDGECVDLPGRTAIWRYESVEPSMKTRVAVKRNLFSFLLEGEKVVHRPGDPIRVSPGQFLLVAGSTCLMTEKLSNQGRYRSLLFFFDDGLLSDFFQKYPSLTPASGGEEPLVCFEADAFVGNFVHSLELLSLQAPPSQDPLQQRQFANTFGCHGENISPALQWENAPAGTQSFAVTIYDKDAPTGSGFWHWLIFNIPADVMGLKSDAGNVSKNLAPAGSIQGNSDYGAPGYGGPCPPPGQIHEYIITVYALKTKLTLDQHATPAIVGFYLNSNVIRKASIVMYAQQ
jgi:Raf kinase inhibitor-like YbhB/YbcL family protein